MATSSPPTNPNPNPNPDTTTDDIDYEFPSYVRVYKNGYVQRLRATQTLPPGTDPTTQVSSKDVTLIPGTDVYARVYLPSSLPPSQKLPLLIYFHGGAFIICTPSTTFYHNYLNDLVAKAKVIAVSVNYRRPPEDPLPIAYEDSWAALQWVASHSNGSGPDPWLNQHADFGKLFIAGDSAGANIAHNIAMAAGGDKPKLGVEILGMALVHPYFWGTDPIGSEGVDPERKARVDRLWPFVCPSSPDNDDPRINPVAEGAPSLVGLGCRRVLICVAEKDVLKDRGWAYYEALGRAGWTGVVEIHESEGEEHVFHLYNLGCEKAQHMIARLAGFFNKG